jgi:hypothetical protein
MSDLRIQRDRQAALDARVDNGVDQVEDCSSAMLATTTTVGTYPTTAAAYYACLETDIGGREIEGGSATYVNGTATVYAINVGTQVPPIGTKVVCHAVGGRWVFRYDG